MARPASGRDVLEQAKQAIASARTVEQLRQAQAVVLPLEFGLTLPQTAQAIGVSVGWACRLRRGFAQLAKGELTPKQRRGGRRRENLTRQQEAQFLAPFFEQASAGGVLIVSSIKQALEGRLGRGVALSSVYNLLHRHGWRKLAPDTRHPQADFAAQEQWKKNSPKRWRRASRKSKGKARSG
jgi:transposase